MAFGKYESFGEDVIEYSENIDMLLHDMKLSGYINLTKEELNNILRDQFSIGRAVRTSLSRILDNHLYILSKE